MKSAPGKHDRHAERKKELQFLQYLMRGWTIGRAASQAGIPYQTIVSRRKSRADFHEECEAAYAEGTDVFEEEANRRAFQGTLKPVYQQGHRVGTIREFSDTLAALVLKRRNPAFKERHEISGTGKDGAFTFVVADAREGKL